MLKVEDGTGLPDSDSYISVEDADQYHAKYGNEEWDDLGDGEKEIALRRATRDLGFLFDFDGEQVAPDEQALDFPRDLFVGLPKCVAHACAELALQSMTVDPTGPTGANTDVQSEELSIGPLTIKEQFFSGATAPEQNILRRVQMLLKPVLSKSQSGSLWVEVTRG